MAGSGEKREKNTQHCRAGASRKVAGTGIKGFRRSEFWTPQQPRFDYQPLFGKMSPHSSPRNSGWTRLISIVGFSQSGCLLQIFVWQHYNLVPRVLSLPPSRKYPGFGWSRGTQNLGANKNMLQGRGSKV